MIIVDRRYAEAPIANLVERHKCKPPGRGDVCVILQQEIATAYSKTLSECCGGVRAMVKYVDRVDQRKLTRTDLDSCPIVYRNRVESFRSHLNIYRLYILHDASIRQVSRIPPRTSTKIERTLEGPQPPECLDDML